MQAGRLGAEAIGPGGHSVSNDREAFTVTADLLDDGAGSAVGQTWPPGTDRIGKDTPGAVRWHAKDDDGEHYYSGYLVGDMTWEVVADWAAGYAGAAAIFDGQWAMVIG